tara:strand:- start:54 stop:530 length:477 start_codon:yes stop_codon:yes gene_type:complete
LNEKVKLGGYCLFCQRQFIPGKPCQQHMIDRGHCKVAYADGVDLDEFEDFYDYDSANADLPVDAEGNPMSREATIDPVTGELTLPSGKTLGHRQYRVFYNQHYEAEDNRPSVVAGGQVPDVCRFWIGGSEAGRRRFPGNSREVVRQTPGIGIHKHLWE